VEELRGKTMGVIGYGDIGQACARLARAFKMRVRRWWQCWPGDVAWWPASRPGRHWRLSAGAKLALFGCMQLCAASAGAFARPRASAARSSQGGPWS
jgi:hypothetical protein